MKAETRQTLTLFVEKANHLESFKFDEHIKNIGLGFKMTNVGNGQSVIEFSLPDDEKRDSFLLTFRLFYMDQESISFAHLSRFLNDPGLSLEWKNGVSAIRHAYYKYLGDYPAHYEAGFFEGTPTGDEIVRTILYGEAAHLNPEMTQKLKLWTADDIRANLLHQEFAKILLQLLLFIRGISELSERELELKPA
jgi:hypothetical protein